MRTAVLFLIAGAMMNVAAMWAFIHVPLGANARFGPALMISAESDLQVNRASREQAHASAWRRIGARFDIVGLLDRNASTLTWIERGKLGWPCSSWKYIRQWTLSVNPNTRRFLLTIDSQISPGVQISGLPGRPIWTGFVINAMLFGVIGWMAVSLIVLAQKSMKQRARARRGLCPACAYDLRGANHDVCPECGKVAHTPID